MHQNKSRAGLTLSGGGIRAAVFHLGVMKFLAKTRRLEDIRAVSTVSGASLAISLVLSKNGYEWPASEEYLNKVLPACRETILSRNIETALIGSKIRRPGRETALLLAEALEGEWGVYGNLQDIPGSLRWEINCSAFETAENFRFSRGQMGGPGLGRAREPVFPVSHAAAASAAFPVLIGTYALDMRPYEWHGGAPRESCRLWDGGIYDNLGLLSLYRPGAGLAPDLDYLIVSDASAPIREQEWSDDEIPRNLLRIWDIKTNESDSLLIGGFYREIVRSGRGQYIKTGTTSADIIGKCALPPNILYKLKEESLSSREAEFVRDYPTNLLSPTPGDFDLILRHGYEAALFSEYCPM